jgi:hypothetical protein
VPDPEQVGGAIGVAVRPARPEKQVRGRQASVRASRCRGLGRRAGLGEAVFEAGVAELVDRAGLAKHTAMVRLEEGHQS